MRESSRSGLRTFHRTEGLIRRASAPIARPVTQTGCEPDGPENVAIRQARVPAASLRLATWNGTHVGVESGRRESQRVALPPESIDQPALTIDAAAGLMADLGFVAFTTPSDAGVTDSCLMAMIRDAPTRRHFDPETVSYWVIESGQGQTKLVDRGARTPISQPFSWGRIRLVDRLGKRNSFVTFGGWLTGERVGADALLLTFRSSAPILRLPGHSQRRDNLADDAMAFFGRLIPRLWSSPDHERLVAALPPDALYGAFLLHEAGRIHSSARLREASPDDARTLIRELELAERHRADALDTGRELLSHLDLAAIASR